jgi:glycosyltransferase involved in cell wall biosynthesis
MHTGLSSSVGLSAAADKYIYIACPWAAKGGGMFKVADYLIQAQAQASDSCDSAQLRPLDTRGGGRAITSILVLATAICRLVAGRLSGRLAGVHVNMAERLSLFRKGLVIVACRALGVPVVLHLHAAQLHHFYRALPSPLKGITRWVFSLPASVIVLGDAARSFVIDELQVPAESVVIVTNGVPEPEARLEPESEQGLQQLLFLGNLMERKGVTDLLEALALPGFDRARLRVTLAGGGDVQGYQAKARELGIDAFVTFTGWSEQAQVASLMAHASVLVLPSYDEGLPLAILEALANSVAVVCSPVGEIPSVLHDNVHACFAQPGDVAGLAATLQRVLYEPGLMGYLGRNGRRLYEQRFSMDRFFASVAQVHKLHFGIAAAAPTHPAPAKQGCA